MTEMDQHGGISPFHIDDDSEKQQESYHSKSEDIDAQGKGGLESANASKLSDEATNQQSCGQVKNSRT